MGYTVIITNDAQASQVEQRCSTKSCQSCCVCADPQDPSLTLDTVGVLEQKSLFYDRNLVRIMHTPANYSRVYELNYVHKDLLDLMSAHSILINTCM